MGLPLGCCYLSVLQVAIIVICCRGKVSGEIEQGCVGSKLSLKCDEMKVINIKAVVLGDSVGYGSVCIFILNACTRDANANHTMNAHRRCDYKHNCSVGVIQEKIDCGYFGWSNNDFERITYDCIDNPRNDTTKDSDYDDSTDDDNNSDFKLGFGTEIARGCFGSQLSLSCPEMKVIEIIDVVIGDSYGVSTACNISYSNCTNRANASHTMDVHHRCNGQSNCTVHVIREKTSCTHRALSWRIYNDFELITYNCINDSRNILTSTDETATVTHISSSMHTEAGAATNGSNSHMLTIVILITCSIILLVIILVIVVMYRRRKGAQMKTRLDPVAMTDVDNCQNEYDVCSNDTQGTSLHNDGYAHIAQPMYSVIEESDSPKRDEKQTIYSEVELRETIWKDGTTDRVTTGQTKAAAAQLAAGTVSKSHSSEDDGGQMVIENDLYDMADNCAKDTAVDSPTRSLAGAASKSPSSQDEEGLTVIDNDIYCH